MKIKGYRTLKLTLKNILKILQLLLILKQMLGKLINLYNHTTLLMGNSLEIILNLKKNYREDQLLCINTLLTINH